MSHTVVTFWNVLWLITRFWYSGAVIGVQCSIYTVLPIPATGHLLYFLMAITLEELVTKSTMGVIQATMER